VFYTDSASNLATLPGAQNKGFTKKECWVKPKTTFIEARNGAQQVQKVLKTKIEV